MFSKGGQNDTFSSSELSTNHSTAVETCTAWYLDSSLENENADDETTDLTCHRQPWRSHWPPKCQKMTEMWLRSEFPEVLSWRFDRKRPFDRPWRTWNRSVRAIEEHSMGFRPQMKGCNVFWGVKHHSITERYSYSKRECITSSFNLHLISKDR